MLQMRRFITTEVSHKGNMIVTIKTEDAELLTLLNSYVEVRLETLKRVGCIRHIINKGDVFIAIPTRDTPVQELLADFNRLVLPSS